MPVLDSHIAAVVPNINALARDSVGVISNGTAAVFFLPPEPPGLRYANNTDAMKALTMTATGSRTQSRTMARALRKAAKCITRELGTLRCLCIAVAVQIASLFTFSDAILALTSVFACVSLLVNLRAMEQKGGAL